MTGFWSTETLESRIPAEGLINPFNQSHIVNCAYELRLGTEVYVTSEQSKVKRILSDGEQLRIPPGQFANLLTEETVRIPPDSVGLLSAKFRWKQQGLVNVSGFHVDPGYEGRILFSVFNAGPTPVIVARGDRLFLLWYCSLDRVTADLYAGSPKNDISSSDISALQGDLATPQALAVRVEKIETAIKIATWIALGIASAIIAGLVGLGFHAFSSDTDTHSSTPTTSAPSNPTSS